MFWENKEWLDKIKEIDFEFYQSILDGKQIDLESETFTLIVDGKRYPMYINDTKVEDIINEKIIN